MTRIRLRLDHLRRLTDPRGLMRSAIGDVPDRSAGYDSIDNADALRFCAAASVRSGAGELWELAAICGRFLSRAREEDGRINHACSAMGGWSREGDDALVQSRLARALAAVMVSELPIPLRMAAAEWWPVLLPHAADAMTPRAAANWIMAIGTLRAADPGRNLDMVETLADWLIEDCYYVVRSNGWEWFEPSWTPAAAVLPAGLWYAYALLGERRMAGIARRTTDFVIDHLFDGHLLMPVGSRGHWQKHTTRPMYDQLPAEAASIVELLRTAWEVSDDERYQVHADRAAAWFTGQNICHRSLIEPSSGGCANAIRADGLDPDQGAAATLASLLSDAAVRLDAPIAQSEKPVYHLVG